MYWLSHVIGSALLVAAFFTAASRYGDLRQAGVIPFFGAGMFLLAAVLFYFNLRWALWPCPRCGHAYSYKFPWANVFRRQCAHCGLQRWADPLLEKGAG